MVAVEISFFYNETIKREMGIMGMFHKRNLYIALKEITINSLKRTNTVSFIAVLLIGVVLIISAATFNWNSINSYEAYNTSTRKYLRGRVLSVRLERLETDIYDSSRYLGEQEIVVLILEGELKGKEIYIDNYLSHTHNIYVRENQKIIVCADLPEGAEPFYTVYNYDRCLPFAGLVVVFVAVMMFVGRAKGIRALLGVAFTLLAVILFMVKAIYHGFSPVVVTIITILITTAVGLVLLNGFSKKTFISVLSTVLGVAVTGIIFFIVSETLHLSGFNADNAEDLLMIRSATGLSIKYILIAGLLISALGAVMDIAVSLTAALDELLQLNPKLTRKELIRSGFNIGKDMIGTMSNTLILAFTGTSLTTMLTLIGYGTEKMQLINSDFLAIEMAQGICATIGVVLTVPIATYIYSYMCTEKESVSKM